MRAFHIPTNNAPAAVHDIPRPEPLPGEVRVKIAACGLNFADLLMLEGKYQEIPDAPFTLGLEAAGIVDAIGDGAKSPPIGTRVAVFNGHGGLAEYGCFPAICVVELPDSMSFTEAAAFQIAYGTGHVALDYKARLQPGETLLVLGAAGGVGLAAVEIGKHMGARVIACARGEEKLAIAAKAGADHLIDAASGDILAECKALGGVDVVYDPVGGPQHRAAFRACRPDARILCIGFASGSVPRIPANHLLAKNISVIGFYWGAYPRFKPQVVTESLATLLEWHSQGHIAPHISHILPLAEVHKALDLLRSRKSTGKVVVTTG